MADDSEASLQQRREELQERLAAQRGLVALRLSPPKPHDAKPDSPVAANGSETSPAHPAPYPRSLTMRLARTHPALAVGALALGLAMLLRGRGEQLDSILSTAKAVEPLFER